MRDWIHTERKENGYCRCGAECFAVRDTARDEHNLLRVWCCDTKSQYF